MLDIRLLGIPLISLDGELVHINRRTTRALLFYLAAKQEPILRMKLTDLFWGDKDEAEQRKRLRSSLNNLRTAFSGIDLVQSYHNAVKLNREILSVDLIEFSAIMKKIRPYMRSWQEGQVFSADVYREALRAVELWRGSRFIENSDMEISGKLARWSYQYNQTLTKERVELYKFLSHLESGFGNERDAVVWAQKALDFDEYDEEAHFLRLRGLLRSNQRKKGLELYQSIEDMLPDFYGNYAGEFENLGRELAKPSRPAPTVSRLAWDTHPSLQAPFVGQQEALKSVRRGYVGGRAVLILGEAGAGKTRLVQEFYQRLDTPHRLLSLSCLSSGENLPYQPWIDMFRREIKDEAWGKLEDVSLNPLSMLLPELSKHKEQRENVQKLSPYAKSIVFDAIKHMLLQFAEETPVILFVDNAQWADEATSASLVYLIEQSFFKHTKLSLIITSRVEETNAGIEKMLMRPLRNRIELVEMNRLSEKDISDLAVYIFQENLSQKAASRLLRITGGNPFFVLEMLSAYGVQLEADQFDTQISVSENVKGLIKIRLEKLQPLSQKILLLAAIQGDPFSFLILEKAEELSPDQIVEVAKELEKAQLIRPTNERKLEYTFVHEILRETLLSSLSSLQKRVLHKKIARALSEIAGREQNKQAAVLAEHYEKAYEFPLAFSQWIQAGKYAYRLFSVDDASAAYRRAEAIIEEKQVPLTEEAIYELYVSWGIMLFENDNPDALEKVMQRFLKIGEECGSTLLTGAALDGMSDVYMARNQFKKGMEHTEEALRFLKISKNIPAQMSALIHHGVFLYMRTRFADAQESIRAALKLGEGKEDPVSLYFYGHALYQMATIFTGMGKLNEAIEYAKKSLYAMRRSRSPHAVLLPYSIMGLTNYYLANVKAGLEYSFKAISLAEQIESWRMLGYAYVYAGLNYTGTTSLGEAWKYAEKAIQIGEKYGHTEITSLGYKIKGDVYIQLDAFAQAKKVYKKGVDVDKSGFAGLENSARLGVTLGLLGEPDAHLVLQKAISQTEKVGLNMLALGAKTLELSILVLQKDYEAFEKNAPLVEQELQNVTHPDSRIWVDYLRALAFLQRGDVEKSLTLFERILARYMHTPFSWIYFRTLKFYIVALKLLRRDATQAKAKLETILRQIEEGIGDAPLQNEWKKLAEVARNL
jgi:DNA-binding SARP family transcriptional activator